MTKKINFEDILKQLELPPDKIESKLLGEIFWLVEKSDEGNEITQKAIKNYIIIRTVSIIENYFKNTIREIVDKHDLQVTGIFPKDEILIPLNELHEIKNEKITKGRILAYAVNFQNFNQINKVITNLLSINDFNKSINEYKHSFQFTEGKAIWFEFKKIHELFEIRHKIIHELEDYDGNERSLKEFMANASMLLSGSESIIKDGIIKNILPKK